MKPFCNFQKPKYLCLALVTLFSLNAAAQEEINWIEFPDPAFEVNGLPWYEENKPDLFRLPKRVEPLVREAVWKLGKSPSGARIRFKSDCTTLGICIKYPRLSGMSNMHVFGQSGVDLYVDGRYTATAIHHKEVEVEQILFKTTIPKLREFVFYLPLYNGVEIQNIGVNPDAVIQSPRPFSIPKPVVFYGTSITQGGCASRSGMSYQAILGRILNIDFVNLGFSGNGKGEKEVAETIAEIDASCFVMDFMANNRSAEGLAKVYEPFLRIIRAQHPETPIIAITRIYAIRGNSLSFNENSEAKRDVVRAAVAKLQEEGDKNLILVEGYDLLGPDLADGLVDGSHPNDLGFQAMADRLAPTLAQVLNLHQPRTLTQ